MFVLVCELVFISNSEIPSSARSLLFAPSSSSIAIVDIVSNSSVFTVFFYRTQKNIFPFLTCILLSYTQPQPLFLRSNTQSILRLLFRLTGVLSTCSTIIVVYNIFSITPLSYILLVFRAHLNLVHITIISVVIGIQWPSCFNASFTLLLFLLYPPNFCNIPTFHIDFVLFIMANYLLCRPIVL